MIRIKNIFSGNTSVTAETQNISIGGTVSNVNRTIFFFTAYLDYDVNFERSDMLSMRLLDASTLQANWIQTYGLALTHYVAWTVIEFNEGVQVQHYFSDVQPSSPISITAVDTAKSFIITNFGINDTVGTNTWNNLGATFTFASSTSITMTTNSSVLYNVSLQIVQWDGAVAQHSTANITNTTPVDVTINAVDTAKTVLASSRNWNGTDPTASQVCRVYLLSSTAVRLMKGTTGFSEDVAVTTITIPQFSVQWGVTSLANAVTSANITINSVKTASSVPWISMSNRPWVHRDDSVEPPGYGGANATRLTFNSATEFNITRGRGWSLIYADWQVFEVLTPAPRMGFTNFQDPGIS